MKILNPVSLLGCFSWSYPESHLKSVPESMFVNKPSSHRLLPSVWDTSHQTGQIPHVSSVPLLSAELSLCPSCPAGTAARDFLGEERSDGPAGLKSGFLLFFWSDRSWVILSGHWARQRACGCIAVCSGAWDGMWHSCDAEEHLNSWASTPSTELCCRQPLAFLPISQFTCWHSNPDKGSWAGVIQASPGWLCSCSSVK